MLVDIDVISFDKVVLLLKNFDVDFDGVVLIDIWMFEMDGVVLFECVM